MEINGVDYRIAETRDDIEGALHLAYHNYIETGYCRPNAFNLHFNLYDVLPETRTLVAVRYGKVIATLTLVFDSTLGLPSDHLYRAGLERLRAASRKVAELSKLAADRSLGARQVRIVKGLFRLAWIAAVRARNMTDFCILVEPHHEPFYRKAYLFERIGELRQDPEAKGAPSVLLRLELEQVPHKYREAFGVKKCGISNPYWFNCLDPDCEELEIEARAADTRLAEMHAHVKAGEALSSPSLSTRRYIDFRRFALRFNIERVSAQAQESGKSGRFYKEIKHYRRLLDVLPSNHEPNEQADILRGVAKAEFYGGRYEETLALAEEFGRLATEPDLIAASHRLAASALHFLNRHLEAQERIDISLRVAGISLFERAKIFRLNGAVASSRSDLESAANHFDSARELLRETAPSQEVNNFLVILSYGRFALERRRGDIKAARAALEEVEDILTGVDAQYVFMHQEGYGSLELELGHPRRALKRYALALQYLTPGANPYNASILHKGRASALFSLGDVDEAMAEAEEALRFAIKARSTGARLSVVNTMVRCLLANDKLKEAHRLVSQHRNIVNQGVMSTSWASLESAVARVAAAQERWDDANEAYEIAEMLVEENTAFRHSLRGNRVKLALSRGMLRDAHQLSEEMPAPSVLRGNASYAALWHAIQSVFLASEANEADSLREFQEATATYMAGEVWLEVADTALSVAEALGACGLSDVCPSLTRTSHDLLTEVVNEVRLPYYARRLKIGFSRSTTLDQGLH